MQVTGSYQELSTLLEDLEKSPEARRILGPQFFNSLRSNVEGKESSPTPDTEKDPDSEQKTG